MPTERLKETMLQRRQELRTAILLCSIVLSLVSVPTASGKKIVDSPLTPEQQHTLDRAAHSMKGGNAAKSSPLFDSVLETANDIPKCLAIAAYTESYGGAMVPVRRQCLQRALTLCSSRDDYLQVVIKARQYECYDVARGAINSLLGTASTPDELYDLAMKAQEVAANDVVHLALEKAFAECKTVPEALNFAKQSKLLGCEDLTYKAIKDLIDDETDAHQLMVLLVSIEPYNMKDLDRYLLKKSLDVSNKFEDYVEIATTARKFGEKDIYEVAVYRAKKKRILQQIQTDQLRQQQLKADQVAQQAQQAQNASPATPTAPPQDNTPKSGF
jgi:hypothetical protein